MSDIDVMLILFGICIVVCLLRMVWLRCGREYALDQANHWEEQATYWQQRACNAERQLPAFRQWPDLTDPGVTQTIRIFDEWGPREQ